MALVLEDIFIENLRELDGIERAQEEFLKSMAEAASRPELQDALKGHAETTRKQSERVRKMLSTIGESGGAEPPEVAKALMTEAQKKIARDADDVVIDLELIAAARKMEHMEVASYSIALAMAKEMGQDEIAGLLEETLREEQGSDRAFERLARPVLKEAEESQETEVEAEVDESDEDVSIPEIRDEEEAKEERPAPKPRTRRAG
jgi:ferritin-like metal-binding protein YciE